MHVAAIERTDCCASFAPDYGVCGGPPRDNLPLSSQIYSRIQIPGGIATIQPRQAGAREASDGTGKRARRDLTLRRPTNSHCVGRQKGAALDMRRTALECGDQRRTHLRHVFSPAISDVSSPPSVTANLATYPAN